MMPLRFIYHILINIVWFGLHVVALFNAKIKLFVQGRKQTFSILEDKLNPTEKTIWMHVASLGEFEQGLPILERLRAQYPKHKLVLSFFSPSGYEVKKNTTAADVVV
jgi:3-deoxy-D-manno-octulosonic-acid transferase